MSKISSKNFKALSGGIILHTGQRIIKINDRMFPIGIGNDKMHIILSDITASASDIREEKISIDSNGNKIEGQLSEFYKCIAIHGPYEVETVVVSGCPVAEVNGDYLPTEFTTSDYNGNTYTVYSNGNYYYNYNTDYGWVISTDYTKWEYLYNGSIGGDWYDANNYEIVEDMSVNKGTTIIDADVPKTWDGHKVIRIDGNSYSFEEKLTTYLGYSDIKPQKYKIYDRSATMKVDLFNQLYPTDALDFFAHLYDLEAAEGTGQKLTNTRAKIGVAIPVNNKLNQRPCAKFNQNKKSSIVCSNGGFIGAGINSWTVFVNFYIDTTTTSEGFLLNVGKSTHLEITVYYYTDTNGQTYVRFDTGAFNDVKIAIPIERGVWNTFTFIHDLKNGKVSAYHGKTHIETKTGTLHGVSPDYITIGARDGDSRWY